MESLTYPCDRTAHLLIAQIEGDQTEETFNE